MATILHSSEKPASSSRRRYVSMIREVYLSMRELEDYIRRFEEKYRMSSADMLRNAELRGQVSEDDIFEWEAFIDHRQELRSLEERVHRGYIQTLKQSRRAMRKSSGIEPLCFAA